MAPSVNYLYIRKWYLPTGSCNVTFNQPILEQKILLQKDLQAYLKNHFLSSSQGPYSQNSLRENHKSLLNFKSEYSTPKGIFDQYFHSPAIVIKAHHLAGKKQHFISQS
jgi:hypothetical protein